MVRLMVYVRFGLKMGKKRKEVKAKAQKLAEEKVLDALVGKKPNPIETLIILG